MANVDNPHGFRPVRSINGGAGNAKVTYLTLAASNSAIGLGDALILSSGDVDIAAAATALVGIAAEAKAASSGGKIAVWADPMQLFEAQTDDTYATAITAATAIGMNADILATAPSGGKSQMEIDESSVTTTATLQLKIVGLYLDPKNAWGKNERLVVKINNHVFGSHTGTVGT